jgi:hypothetical protein
MGPKNTSTIFSKTAVTILITFQYFVDIIYPDNTTYEVHAENKQYSH